MLKSREPTTLLLSQSPARSRPKSAALLPPTSVTLPEFARYPAVVLVLGVPCGLFTSQLYVPAAGAVTVKEPLASVLVLNSMSGPPLARRSVRVIGKTSAALG